METEKNIDYLINNKNELLEQMKIWEDLKFKVKTNEEYWLILKRIRIGEAILNAL